MSCARAQRREMGVSDGWVCVRWPGEVERSEKRRVCGGEGSCWAKERKRRCGRVDMALGNHGWFLLCQEGSVKLVV